ncbi:MAG: diphthine--ammonia ligase [Bacteroidetes bacterium]|nr:diphthine--ammonia ligase [Bacteroidota bacterium]HET6243930.1 diphthine--ammonia ligase [Bacteroidia bacterium]
MQNNKAALFWSGGKDSAFALWQIKKENKLDVKYLVTTINRNFKRVSMHGLSEEVLERQAAQTEIPLIKMYVEGASNKNYEASLTQVFENLKKEGINKVIFGDIFLEDLRKYRDDLLHKFKVQGIYPLWKQNTSEIFNQLKSDGFKTLVCCVNATVLDENFVGKELTADLISTMPQNVDICGENGEFHTFCFEGPVFSKPIQYSLGEKVFKPLEIKQTGKKAIKPGFWFIDII